MKNDQSKKKEEKQLKKSKKYPEAPVKKSKMLEEVGSKNILNKSSDPPGARKRRQRCIPDGGEGEWK